jgi:hypothetical protein
MLLDEKGCGGSELGTGTACTLSSRRTDLAVRVCDFAQRRWDHGSGNRLCKFLAGLQGVSTRSPKGEGFIRRWITCASHTEPSSPGHPSTSICVQHREEVTGPRPHDVDAGTTLPINPVFWHRREVSYSAIVSAACTFIAKLISNNLTEEDHGSAMEL